MASRPPWPAPRVSVTYASSRRVTLPSTLLSPVHSESEDEDLRRPNSTADKPNRKGKRVHESTGEEEWVDWSQDLRRRLGDAFDCEAKTSSRDCPQGMRFLALREEKRVRHEALGDPQLDEVRTKKRASTG